MRNDMQESRISVAVPTVLYLKLVDQLSRAHIDCEPTKFMTSILQKWLDESPANLPRQGTIKSAPDWSNDWIMFGSPPPVRKDEIQISLKKLKTPQSTEWCIGCASPSEELLSA